MSKVELIKEKINLLNKSGLITVLLEKTANNFGRNSAKEKYEKMGEDQLREEIIKSYKSGSDSFDDAFVLMLPDYLKIYQNISTVEKEYVQEVMEHFDFCNEKYKEQKRRQNIADLLTNLSVMEEVKDFISHLLLNDTREDDFNQEKEVEVIFLHLIFELLYVTTSN